MISVGNFNVMEELVNVMMRLGTLERAFEYIIQNNPGIKAPNQADIQNFQNQTLAEMQQRFPDLGIGRK